MDMADQSQPYSVLALLSLLCILQCINKKRPFTSYPSAKYKNTRNIRLTDIRKTEFFDDTSRVSALAPAIILLTQAPLQKFLFLFSFKFPGFGQLKIRVFHLLCWSRQFSFSISTLSYQPVYL